MLYVCLAEFIWESFHRHEVAKPKPGVDIIISPGAGSYTHEYRLWPPRLREDVEEMMAAKTGV
jgi:hypothetical protein